MLRVLLGQENALAEWDDIERGVTSVLTEVECLRTLDRMRVARGVAEGEVALRRETVVALLRSTETVDLSAPILRRAGQPLPVTVGTLDALHLTTALLWRDFTGIDLVMATHDAALASAAKAMGLIVVGA
ncbi:MAG: PIN domain-containing protein [Thermoleophilia bacterium]|nr:PIN domain-containing protein [Thermoleophilia bacterium]